MKIKCEVTQDRFIAGQHRKVGAVIELRAAQAKYYLPPHGTGLKSVKPAAKEKLAKPAAKQS